MKLTHAVSLIVALLGPAMAGAAAAGLPDPLDSARWQDMRQQYFAQARVSFDPRVRVSVPGVAEDPLQVPVTVDASALPDVRQVLVIADFNPYPLALRFSPRGAKPFQQDAGADGIVCVEAEHFDNKVKAPNGDEWVQVGPTGGSATWKF